MLAVILEMVVLVAMIALSSGCGRADCYFDNIDQFSGGDTAYSVCIQPDGTYKRTKL